MRVPTQEVGVPTYQYACKEPACGHRFEAVQSFSDDPLSTCPVCEGNVRKVFSAVGVVFKGSGFYRTDSRESSKSAAGAAKPKDNGSSESKSGSGSGSSEKSSSSSESSGSSSSSSPAGASSGSSSSGSSSSGSTSTAAAS
jgi:putative FmdB family regulatory protein